MLDFSKPRLKNLKAGPTTSNLDLKGISRRLIVRSRKRDVPLRQHLPSKKSLRLKSRLRPWKRSAIKSAAHCSTPRTMLTSNVKALSHRSRVNLRRIQLSCRCSLYGGSSINRRRTTRGDHG